MPRRMKNGGGDPPTKDNGSSEEKNHRPISLVKVVTF